MMLTNYFKIALRNLWKNKGFSAINILGLAAGLAVCLLIVLYVVDELNYDTYNVKANRIFRLESDLKFNGTQFSSSSSPKPLGPSLVKDFSQVETMVRIHYESDVHVKKEDETIQDHNEAFADSTFFSVFTIPMLAGNPQTALNEPNSIVLDETAAKRYFNTTDVIGKTLYVDNSATCKITGVMKDIPRQSHFHFSFIRPLRDSYMGNEFAWLSNNVMTYVLVKPGVTATVLQKDVNATINNYLAKELEATMHTSMSEVVKGGNHFKYTAVALPDIHLRSAQTDSFEPNGSITYVYIFSLIAVFILLIACVNFMNLSTARSANRAKEVGIRKVAGSLRSHLILQFLTESVLVSFLALLFALAVCTLLLPLFNGLAGKNMQISTLFSTWMFPVMIALVLVVGCVAGSYPAFYLSAFKPIEVLKGNKARGFKSSWLRSSLVVFQFSISIILIIGTIVIYNQLHYMQSRQIGYNRNQVLILHNTNPLDKQIKAFTNDLRSLTGVENATVTSTIPTMKNYDQNGWFADPTPDAKKAVILAEFSVDENYIPTLGMQMAKGRNFSVDFPSDSMGVILNESAIKLLGYKDPLKEQLYNSDENGKPTAYHVVGVVKDFNFTSMHDKVGPLIMHLGNNTGDISLRVNTKDIPSLLSRIESKWNSMAPGQPFTYTFMDADFNNIYSAEQRTGKLFITFATFAIFIGCLGLFGLVTYAAEQRTKEIGVRKVLGASVSGIVVMLSKDFAKLVLIASLLAFPVSFFAMNEWLQGFAYRISISPWIFVIAGVSAILLALLTVSFQAIKAAMANPVKSLRTE